MGRPRTPAGDRESRHSKLLSPGECAEVVRPLSLPPRQAGIVALILQGKRDKQIAALLGLRRTTVRTYLSRVFVRLGVADRMELVLCIFANCLRKRP